MSASAVETPSYGQSTSTVYQQQQQQKKDAAAGKVSHTDFLTLLTQQLVHQDPLNPMQDIDFTGQLAQLQALDEQMTMTKAMQGMRVDTQLQAGTNMIGKFVSGVDSSGTTINGMVSRVSQTDGEVFVELADKRKVSVGSISNVWNDANSMFNEIANSSNVIGKWVECGYDSAQQPIKGIVESMQVVNGQVQLKLYGGKSVTWDQIKVMRVATQEEQFYVLPDAVRQKVETAQKMVNLTVDGKDKDGKEISGVVADATLEGSDVYLLLYTGEQIKLEDVKGEPRAPTPEDAAKSLDGLWAEGYDKAGEKVTGIVVGAAEDDSGMYVVLDNGQKIHFDSVSAVTEASDENRARLHGKWITGTDAGGNSVGGIVTEKKEVDGKLAFTLHDGTNKYTILCQDTLSVRNPTTEETAAVKAAQDAEKAGG